VPPAGHHPAVPGLPLGRGPGPVNPPASRPAARALPGAPVQVTGRLPGQQARVRQWGITDKNVYLGIELAGNGGLAQLAARTSRRAASAGTRYADDEAAQLADIVAGPGLSASPATPRELQWLMLRSCWLLLPAPLPVTEHPAPAPYSVPGSAPHDVDSDGLAALTGGLPWTAEPWARTVTITRPDGLTRHVAVLAVDDMTGQDVPQESPWLQRTDRLGFPAEWAVTFDVRPRAEVAREMRGKITQIRHQLAHIEGEHGQQAPVSLERQNQAARRVEDESVNGSVMSTRVAVWARVAVAGETVAEALRRAGQVAELYSPGLSIYHPPDQYRLAREFIPGEPLSSRAHTRRMPAALLAAGVPAAAAAVGDRDGFPLGTTASLSAGAVTINPWAAMERSNRSGLIAVTGSLGAGKTTLIGKLIYMAVRAGIASVVLDPSALLARLCLMPELAAHAQAVDLLNSPPGTLCPYALIAEPRLDDFLDDGADYETAQAEWQRARAAAGVRRRQLTDDILRMLLPPETVDKKARHALSEAIRRAPADVTASPADVITALEGLRDYGLEEDAHFVAAALQDLVDHPWGRLFFRPAEAGPAASADVLDDDRMLTVLTLKGLALPGAGRLAAERTVDERLSIPVLHLAAYLTRRHVLDRPRHHRALLALDEAHALTRDGVGKALINEITRDSRKHNLCALIASHLGKDLKVADIAGLVGASFAGRTEGEEEQAAALALAGLPPGQGHEARLAALSADSIASGTGAKEFLYSDSAGRREIIRVDLGATPGLAEALNSTPTGRRGRLSAGGPHDPAAAAPLPDTRREQWT
jgi:hypothetical protein